MKKETLGEKICAAVLSEQLGLEIQFTWKKYIKGRPIDPSWQKAGEFLLRSNLERSEGTCCESEAPAN